MIQGELVEVPKVLGDLLESVLGAVFLDSGHSLSAVWEVFRFSHPSLVVIHNTLSCNHDLNIQETLP